MGRPEVRATGHQLSPESKRKLAEFRTMLEASEGNTGASDNAADAPAPQIRSSGAAADPSADSPRKIDEETIDAVDMAGDAAEVAMADGDKMADPMADAADMADPMADAADASTDAAENAAYIAAGRENAADEEVIAGDEEVIAADAADADADAADASDPNGIAAEGPLPPMAHGPGGLQTDVADPPVVIDDGPRIPESGNDGKNGMLGKLMVSIMEKLGNGEPIKMIVDVKNPEAMIPK